MSNYTQAKQTAWDLIGFDGQVDGEPASVRIHGGRSLYEAVGFSDDTPGTQVRLSRLVATAKGLRVITRYVDPDTRLEVILDTKE